MGSFVSSPVAASEDGKPPQRLDLLADGSATRRCATIVEISKPIVVSINLLGAEPPSTRGGADEVERNAVADLQNLVKSTSHNTAISAIQKQTGDADLSELSRVPEDTIGVPADTIDVMEKVLGHRGLLSGDVMKEVLGLVSQGETKAAEALLEQKRDAAVVKLFAEDLVRSQVEVPHRSAVEKQRLDLQERKQAAVEDREYELAGRLEEQIGALKEEPSDPVQYAEYAAFVHTKYKEMHLAKAFLSTLDTLQKGMRAAVKDGNDWTKQEYTKFLRGSEKFGRSALQQIAEEVGTKTLEEVTAYSKARSLRDDIKALKEAPARGVADVQDRDMTEEEKIREKKRRVRDAEEKQKSAFRRQKRGHFHPLLRQRGIKLHKDLQRWIQDANSGDALLSEAVAKLVLDRTQNSETRHTLLAQGLRRIIHVRVDGTDEIIECTLVNGWVSDELLEAQTNKEAAEEISAKGKSHPLLWQRDIKLHKDLERWIQDVNAGKTPNPLFSDTDLVYQIKIGQQNPIRARIGRHFEYAHNERLLMLTPAEQLVDATVAERVGSIGSRYLLQLGDGLQVQVDLNPWNHAIQRSESAAAFREGCARYVTEQLEMLMEVHDAITGNRLKVEGQLIFIGTKEAGTKASTGGVRRRGWNGVSDMKDLAEMLGAPSPARSHGAHDGQSVLILAGPGTGKTWSTQQLAYLLLQKARTSSEPLPPLPLLVRVQRMLAVLTRAGIRIQSGNKKGSLLEEYIKRAFDDGAVRDALLQAYALKSLVVIIDGADEAAGMRAPIETLVLQDLQLMRVVISSRPQELNGVNVSEFQHFVIMDLKPLSEEQQRAAISQQLKDADHFEHLTALSKIRREHDRIYKEAFPDEAERAEIEGFEQANLFFAINGKRDPGMRQQRRNGSGFVRVCMADRPESEYLRQLCSFFSAPLLAELNTALLKLEDTANEAEVKLVVAGLQSSTDVQRLRAMYGEQFFDLEDDVSAEPTRCEALKLDARFKDLKLAVKLGLLLLKRREKELDLTVEALWDRVWRRTDEVFVATEDLKLIFEGVVRQFATCLGLEEKALKFGPLKDAVRIHEKAMDDYIHDFDDWNDAVIIAEACVVDVLRVRIVVQSGQQMLRLQRLLRDGFKVTLTGEARSSLLRMIRAKNKLSTTVAEERGLAGLDPTHFRNILNNVQLIHDGRTVFAEIQVHHAAILEFNDESHAHDHYNFFRAKLADSYGRELDAMLERAILFFVEVGGSPVLLSMLVLVFSGRSDSESLPSSKSELYRMATHAAIRKRLATSDMLGHKSRLQRQPSSLDSREVESMLTILSRVAIAAHLAEKREFTGKLVKEAINSAALEQWNAMLADARGIPLVKVIEAGDGVASSFQFAHLSFQEGLFAQALADGSAADALDKRFGSNHRDLLGDARFLNALIIGGSAVGATLKVDDEELWLSKAELNAMTATHWALLGSERQVLQLRGLYEVDNVIVVNAVNSLATLKSLKKLDLAGNNLGVECGKAIVAVLEKTQITSLNILNNNLGDSVDTLVAAARELPQLVTLCGIEPEREVVDFSHRGLNVGDAKLLAFDLSKNQTIGTLNLDDNRLCGSAYSPDMSGILKLAEALPRSHLTSLSLDENYLTGPYRSDMSVIFRLAEVLPYSQLTSLSLAYNELRVEGCKAIMAVLDKTRITSLNVDGHALPIAELRGTKPVESLDLSGEDLGFSSGVIIAACIKENAILRELNLQRTNLNTMTLQIIRVAAGSRCIRLFE